MPYSLSVTEGSSYNLNASGSSSSLSLSLTGPAGPSGPAGPAGSFDGMPAAITFAGDDPNVPQIITISGALTTNGTTPLVFPPIPYIGVNQGKPEYYYEAEGVEVTAVWTGTRWELQDFISGVGWFNNTAFASPDLVTPWLALGSNTGTPVVTAGPSLQGTAIGQLCKTPDAWWRWDGSAWEEDAAGGVTDHGALDGLGDDDHPQYAKLAGANTFTSTSNSFTQPLYLNSAILGVVTSPIAGAYNGNGAGLTGDAQNLIVGYATLAGVAYSFAGTLPIESGGTGGSTAGAARTALGIPTPPESKIATGDISITNDATSLTNSSRDDFDIVNFSLDANSTYRFTIYFEYTSTSAAGIKIGVNFPSLAGNGAQRGGVVINPSGAIANFPQVAASLYQFATGVATTRGTIVATIIARTGIVGGIGSLRWAQLTSGPDITTRHAGSSMTVEKLTT